MLEYIEFTKNHNVMSDLTKNTIIICPNHKTMATLADEIINTINGEAEYNNYDCGDADVNKGKFILCFGLREVIQINEQTITLALEPSAIFEAECPEDIWFVNIDANQNEEIYSLTSFIGYKGFWNEGLRYIYKMLVNGKLGCYDGSWVNLE